MAVGSGIAQHLGKNQCVPGGPYVELRSQYDHNFLRYWDAASDRSGSGLRERMRYGLPEARSKQECEDAYKVCTSGSRFVLS